ncbi:MAG: divergent polysaccharide deacetylase family protein [Parvibaculaceae bacterium]|nr:divergent polysaccharide deacetylase family protein [Parvibaculaceae bacterium]
MARRAGSGKPRKSPSRPKAGSSIWYQIVLGTVAGLVLVGLIVFLTVWRHDKQDFNRIVSETQGVPASSEQKPVPPVPPVPPIVAAPPVAPPVTPPPVVTPPANPPVVVAPKKAETAHTGRAVIALVIDDVGIDKAGARKAIALPPQITLAFMPYATNVAAEAREALGAGHEILVHMPMQPLGAADPGPHALRADDTPEKLQQEIDWNLARFSGYTAVNNHMGSRMTEDPAAMRILMKTLKARGLFFLDSRTTARTVAAKIAGEEGVPSISRDVFIDNDQTPADVERQLAETEHIALKTGVAIAIGHPHPVTLAVVSEWLKTLPAKGIELVPVASVVKR